MKEIDFWNFLDWLKKPIAERSSGEIYGPILLQSSNFPQALLLPDTKFNEDVDLEGATINGTLDLSRCLFRKRLSMRGVEIKGELRLDDAELFMGLDLTGAHVHRGIRALRLTSKAAVDISRITSGSVVLTGAQLNSIVGSQSCISGDLRFDASVRGEELIEAKVETIIDCPGARIEGSVFFNGLSVRNLDFHNAIVKGDLLAVTSWADRGKYSATIFENASFEGFEVHGNVRFGGVALGHLNMSQSSIGGDLRLDVSVRGAELIEAKVDTIECPGVKIDGSVFFNGLAVRNLNFHNAIVKGDLLAVTSWLDRRKYSTTICENAYFEGLEVHGNVRFGGVALGYLNMCNATIFGRFDVDDSAPALDGVEQNGANFHASDLDQSDALARLNDWLNRFGVRPRANSPLSPYGHLRSTIVQFDAAYLTLHGPTFLQGLEVINSLAFDGSSLGGDLRIFPDSSEFFRPEVGDDITLTRLRNSPFIEVNALRCGGELRIVGSELGRTRLLCDQQNRLPCSIGLLTISNTQVKGELDLSNLQVDGTKSRDGLRGLVIRDSRIDGDIRLWKKGWAVGHDDSSCSWENAATVVGPVDLSKCLITGDCDLTFLKAQESVAIESCTISGSLFFMSTVTWAKAHGFVSGARGDESTFSKSMCCAVAPRVSLRKTKVEGDVDLSGLTLYHDDPLDSAETSGVLDATSLIVHGELIAYDSHERYGTAFANVPGIFDLDSAQVHSLRAAEATFSEVDDSKKDKNLSLAGGQFGQVTLQYEAGPQTKPCKISSNLSKVEVGAWRLGDISGVSSSLNETSLYSYERFFRTAVFERSLYEAVEKTLKSRGREDAASEIYRAMNRREAETRLPILKSLRDLKTRMNVQFRESCPPSITKISAFLWLPIAWLWSMAASTAQGAKIVLWDGFVWPRMLGYGTDPTPLAVIILIFALISFPVYRNPKNVEAQQDHDLLAQVTELPGLLFMSRDLIAGDINTKRHQWNAREAFIELLHYHLPFVPLSENKNWILREDPGTYYDLSEFYGGDNSASDLKQAVVKSSENKSNRFRFYMKDISPQGWADAMVMINIIMWPFVLTFFFRRLLRQS